MSRSNHWSGTKPRQVGEAWVRREGEGTAIFNPKTGQLHLLNPSALAIWELCDGGTTAEEMAEAIDELTGLGTETTSADVYTALDGLNSAGLIEQGDD